MNKCFFSIIIPIYNMELFINRCVNSIIEQEFKDYEILLIDDGSEDSSKDICDEFAEKYEKIKSIHKKNEGQASARNYGLSQAIGKYIIFIDADDWIGQGYLKRAFDIINKYNVDAVFFGEQILTYKYYKDMVNVNADVKLFNNNDIMKLFANRQKINTTMTNKICKKEIWNELKFPNIRCREDAYIMHELLSKCDNIAITEDSYYFYYQRTNSTERKQFDSNRLISIEIGDRCQKFYKENYSEFYNEAFLNCYLERIKNMIIEICNKDSVITHRKDLISIIKKLRKELKKVNKNMYDKANLRNLNKIRFFAYFPLISIIFLKCKKVMRCVKRIH